MKSCLNCGNFINCELEEKKRVVLPGTECAYHTECEHVPLEGEPVEYTCEVCGKELKGKKGVISFTDGVYKFFCCQKHYSEYFK